MSEKPKISIITACHNNAEIINATLQSVADQGYPYIEHIIVDGKSTDNTVEIVSSFSHIALVISEPDKGMYEAINKGIKASTGDYIGILNSDDVFSSKDIISQVVKALAEPGLEAIYGDVRHFTKDMKTPIRYYSSQHFNPSKFKFGHMPAHPSYYASKESFEKYGYYKTDYKIAGDFELLLRHMYVNKIKCKYINLCMVNMRTGGMSNSNIRNRLLVNREMVRACRENGINSSLFQMSRKIFRKISEYLVPLN